MIASLTAMRICFMLGKHMKNKKLESQLNRDYDVIYRNENHLLSELVDNYQNSIKFGG